MADEKTADENGKSDTESGNRSRQFAFNCALSAGCCLLSILFVMFCIISIISAG